MHCILVVDDDLNFRRSLVIQLELEGYTVTEAESVTQALTFLEKSSTEGGFPDIVLSDVKMPDIGGAEFIFRLRQLYPDLPVVAISAFDSPEQLKGLPFLRKPFKIEKLVEAIRKSLGDHPSV